MLGLHPVHAADFDAVALHPGLAPCAPARGPLRGAGRRLRRDGLFSEALLGLQGAILLHQVGQSGGDPSQTDIVFALVAVDQFLEEFEILRLHRLSDLLLEEPDAPVADILAGRQVHLRNRLPRRLLDGGEHAPLARRDEKDRLSLAPRPSRTADTVDVGFGVGGDVVIDDMADALDVETAGGHVGGDDDVEVSILEALDRLLPQRLRHVSVEGSAGEAARLQLLHQFHGGDLGAHEDEHGVEILGIEDAGQGIELVQSLDLPVALGDGGDGGRLGLDADLDGITQMAKGDLQHLLRHGGREKGRLPPLRSVSQDLFHLIDKPHAQHLVRLVEHNARELVELQGAAVQVVLNAPRRSDHGMDAALQLAQLLPHVLPPVDRKDLESRQVTRIGLHRLGDLQRQLPCGGQDKDLRTPDRRVEATEERQGKGSRLAGAGLGLAEQVASCQQRRNAAGLDRRRDFVADLVDGLLDRLGESQLGESGNSVGVHVTTYGKESGRESSKGSCGSTVVCNRAMIHRIRKVLGINVVRTLWCPVRIHAVRSFTPSP